MKNSTRTPHVAPEWTEAFILELRMLDVPGKAIGTALADVDAHCADTGESAEDAFGEPVTYARALGLPRETTRFSTEEVVGHGAGLVGLFLVSFSAGAWANHQEVSVTAGLLTSTALILTALSAILRRPDDLMRAVVERPWLLVAGNVVVVAGVAALLIVLDASVVGLPALPVASVGALLVAFSTITSLRSKVFSTDDRVLGPEGEDGIGSLETGRPLTVLSALGPWVPAIATVVLGLGAAAPRLF